MAPIENERGGRRLNLDGPIVGEDVRGYVEEEATLGWNVWGGRYPIVWGGELIESKKKERETGRRPWWPPFGGTTQQ